jgi:hypothetical protein
MTATRSTWNPGLGIGVQRRIASNWGLRLDLNRYRFRFSDGDHGKVDVLTVGLSGQHSHPASISCRPPTMRSLRASQDSRRPDIAGTALGRAQTKYILSAMLGRAESAPIRPPLPRRAKSAELNVLMFGGIVLSRINPPKEENHIADVSEGPVVHAVRAVRIERAGANAEPVRRADQP